MRMQGVVDEPATVLQERKFDIAVWAAGYEARSRWLVQSDFRPSRVDAWYRVEFAEHRESLTASESLEINLGAVFGGHPERAGRDGAWFQAWTHAIAAGAARKGGPVDVFVDYSSMPRTVYGALLVQCMRAETPLVRSLTLAYVPGRHAGGVDGSRAIVGLRGLVGTEGGSRRDGPPAFVIGLGYDGALAEALVDLFQISQFSVFYGDPGVQSDSVSRVLEANEDLLTRSDLVDTAAAHSVGASMRVVERLARWYLDLQDVLVVPLGPKPHVVGALLAAAANPLLGFRFPKTKTLSPIEVTVPPGSVPFVTRIDF
jgi:hypothetical protein